MAYRLEIEPDERDEPDDGEPPPRRRRQLRWIVGTFLVVLVVFGAWAGYRLAARGGSGGGVPIIRADQRPTKVKPDQPGGMVVPDQDKYVLNRERLPKVEQLLPAPEAPLPRPAPPPEPPAAQPEPPSGTDAAPAAPATPPPAQASAPPKAEPAPPPAKAPAAAAQKAEPPAAKAPTATGTTAPHPPAATGKGYRLQIGAVRTPDAAKAEWERLQRQNHDLLGGLGYSSVRADLGDKGVFYRIQAGPVGDLAAAERICGQLKQRHLGCIPVKP
jgi:cell division septation protein DedD